MKISKKGFTMLDLILTMAVIAILVAIMIPVFSSIVKKAQMSNDVTMAKNLNTALAIYAVDNKIEDYSDPFRFVLDAICSRGYSSDDLIAKAGDCYFVWESDSNQILLIETKSRLDMNEGLPKKKVESFEVIYSVGEYSVIDEENLPCTWYFAIKDKDEIQALKAEQYLVHAHYLKVAGSIGELKSELNNGGTQTIYIGSDLTIDKDNRVTISKENSDITLMFGNTTAINPEQISGNRFNIAAGGEKLTIVGGTIIDKNTGSSSHTIAAQSECDLEISGTTIKSDAYVSVMSYNTYAAAKERSNIKIENTTIEGETFGVYLYYSDAKINDSVIKAQYPVFMSHGAVLTIDGGTYVANGPNIAVVAHNYKANVCNPTTLNIKSGEFYFVADKSNDGDFIFDITGGSSNGGDNIKIVISGGTFISTDSNGNVISTEDYKTFFDKYLVEGSEWYNSIKKLERSGGFYQLLIQKDDINGVYTLTRNDIP